MNNQKCIKPNKIFEIFVQSEIETIKMYMKKTHKSNEAIWNTDQNWHFVAAN